ncbi:hypothetical protein DTL42_04520 [Bremerella cremea]|uniref:Carboxypeptidase regulatory-like domain-containing protein n=2 Tax=Bremerella cremea TaxID=1031537 RepID=A0A368KXL5_9BACT|nr:hypothetical protein DTL42_04520 [Bremerella cremea]
MLVLVGLLFPLLGCGGPKEIIVKGKVTYDGQPVDNGQIIFIPKGEGKVSAGPITNGEFNFAAPPGEMEVKITATKELAKAAKDGLPNYVSYIPKKYNDETSLTATVEDKAENTINFDLEK